MRVIRVLAFAAGAAGVVWAGWPGSSSDSAVLLNRMYVVVTVVLLAGLPVAVRRYAGPVSPGCAPRAARVAGYALVLALVAAKTVKDRDGSRLGAYFALVPGIWAMEILLLLVIAAYVAGLLILTSQRAWFTRRILPIGIGFGAATAGVLYALAPLGVNISLKWWGLVALSLPRRLARHSRRGARPSIARHPPPWWQRPAARRAASAAGRPVHASDADREKVAGVLRAGFAGGRLTKEELDLRLGQTLAARTYVGLAALTADLPAGRPSDVPVRMPARAHPRPRRTGHRVGRIRFDHPALLAPIFLSSPGSPPAGNHHVGLILFMVAVVYFTAWLLVGRRCSAAGPGSAPAREPARISRSRVRQPWVNDRGGRCPRAARETTRGSSEVEDQVVAWL